MSEAIRDVIIFVAVWVFLAVLVLAFWTRMRSVPHASPLDKPREHRTVEQPGAHRNDE